MHMVLSPWLDKPSKQRWITGLFTSQPSSNLVCLMTVIWMLIEYEMSSYQCKNFLYMNKMVSWLSYLYNGNPSTGKIHLYWTDPLICMLHDVDNLKQDCNISIANALEISQSCTSHGYNPCDIVVINDSESSWWLLMSWCLVGARTSATIMMTSTGSSNIRMVPTST